MLALPGSAYIYQGEELGLPEVVELPDEARADPTFRRTGGKVPGRDGCRVPLPWTSTGSSFGFSTGHRDGGHAAPWLPQPGYWGQYSVADQIGDPGSFLNLYRAALRLRRTHPALGLGTPGPGAPLLRWLRSPPDMLCFTREPGFIFAANLGRPRPRCRRTPDPAGQRAGQRRQAPAGHGGVAGVLTGPRPGRAGRSRPSVRCDARALAEVTSARVFGALPACGWTTT